MMTPEQIGARLRAGERVADVDFDSVLPEPMRRVSSSFWTGVGVAMRITRWLEMRGVPTVLDVGSGVGKFCVVGALCSPLRFTGVEQRPHLVDAAEALAQRFSVNHRVSFVRGDLDTVDVRQFDALYFYNPFEEYVFPARDRLDDTVEGGKDRFGRDVAKAETLLDGAAVGTHLVTYNGFGGRVPDSYQLITAKPAGINVLRLWRKDRQASTGGYWLEQTDATLLRNPGSSQEA
jgi:hypothetical protein